MQSLESEGEDAFAEMDGRAQRRLATEAARLESEKKRMELACFIKRDIHRKLGSSNVSEYEWAFSPVRGVGVTKLGPWLRAWPPGVCVGLGSRN